MRKNRRVKLLIAVLCMAAVVACVAVCGCSPSTQASSNSGGSDAKSEAVSDLSFFNNSAGDLFPDTYTNNQLLNIGNRGCNSCHPNLADKMGDPTRPELHAVVRTGYGKALTIKDCGSCHGLAAGFYSPYLGDLVHASHYSNETFVEEYNGNCWNCHSMQRSEAGEWEIVLWEDAMYEPTLGGYYDAVSNPKSREWVRDHGHDSDYLTGTKTEANPIIDVAMNQDVTALEDKFLVYNYPPDNLDMDAISSMDNTLTIKGVVNETEFTLDELKAMPSTTLTAAHVCVTNGQGGSLVGNYEYKGVMLKDLIEACGGYANGVNMGTFLCYDNWRFASNPITLGVMENAMVAYEINGEALDVETGSPTCLVLPGMPAGMWGKYLKEISFIESEVTYDILAMATQKEAYQGLMNYINSGWFQNDGVEVKLGESMELTGWAWGWAGTNSPVTKLSFSIDGGVTWVDQELPADFDPNQMTSFTLKWTPQEAGTFIVKVNAFNADGIEQYVPSSIIVKVTE